MRVLALDDVAALVGGRVQAHGPTTAGAAASAVALLVGRLRDDRLDPAGTQRGVARPGGVGLVTRHGLGADPGPPYRPCQTQLFQQGQQHRGVPCLAVVGHEVLGTRPGLR